MQQAEAAALVARHPWWYHRFEIFPGVTTPGVYDPSYALANLKLPDDMTGLTVLEIGPADGFFTKQLDLRGADVTAMDYNKKDVVGFGIMERLHGKSLRFVHSNLFDIDRHGFQSFDYVLCLGVLYHLPDMLRGIWALRPYVKRELIIETLISRSHEQEPIAEYLHGESCNSDITNFWAPNRLCCEHMLKDAGLNVSEVIMADTRAMFRAVPDESPGAGHKMSLAYSTRAS